MADCGTVIQDFQAVNAELDVVSKYTELMQATIGEDSLYVKAKETLHEIFNDFQLSEQERVAQVTGFVLNLATNLSNSAMQTALGWSKEERDGAYALAKLKADTEIALASIEKVKADICIAEKELELKCAEITAVSAASIRDNGRVQTYEADGCKVASLYDEGLKYEQIKQVEADVYRIHADNFRKSGIVVIGRDPDDNVVKGLSGDEDGYTYQQIINAERQRIAYEDSKRNHVANSTASMIGQMLTAEEAPSAEDVQRWREAIDYLNTSHSSTSRL